MGTDGLGSAWLSDRAICAHLIHAGRYLWAYLQRPILRGRYDGRAAKPAHSGGDDPDARKVVPGSSQPRKTGGLQHSADDGDEPGAHARRVVCGRDRDQGDELARTVHHCDGRAGLLLCRRHRAHVRAGAQSGFYDDRRGSGLRGDGKGENKEEVDSIIANTKIKYTLALEDPDKTLDVFKTVAGQAITVETGSYEGSVNPLTATNYRQNLSGSIQRRDRIELQELKALKEMEGVLIFKDQVIRARSFTWFHSAKFSALPFRLNRFLQVDAPTLEALTGKLAPRQSGDPRFKTIDRMMEIIQSGQAPDYA